jgi:hypothetical protein
MVMNTNLELKTGNWLLVVGTRTTIPTLLRMVGRLAETGPVRVVDGGFSFNPYIMTSGMRGGIKLLDRIQVSRVYSCREMLGVLESMASAPLGAEMADPQGRFADGDLRSPRPDSSPTPFVILDFLTTFFYFFESLAERKCVLRACLAQLNRLEQGSGGLVSVHLPAVLSQAESELLGMLTRACNDTYHVELAAAAALPVRVC